MIKDTIIRPATPADAESLLKIYSPYITDTSISFETDVPTIEGFASRIESIVERYPYLVCEFEKTIIGFAYASRHRERAAYRFGADVSVYVSPEHHRRGIGNALYERLFVMLKDQGVYTVYAGIALPNEASIELHKSFGFREIGTYHNVGYKRSKWIDVSWFEKPLREYDNPERPNSDITIRLAVPADALDMAEILSRSWEATYKDIIPGDFIREKNATRPEQYKRAITDDNRSAYVIQSGVNTVGIMTIAPPQDDDLSDDYYELHVLYLHPDCYRQGIGSIAMEFAYNKARCLSKHTMTLWVLSENINAIRFYEKCGFVEDGKTKSITYGKVLEGKRMRRSL